MSSTKNSRLIKARAVDRHRKLFKTALQANYFYPVLHPKEREKRAIDGQLYGPYFYANTIYLSSFHVVIIRE